MCRGWLGKRISLFFLIEYYALLWGWWMFSSRNDFSIGWLWALIFWIRNLFCSILYNDWFSFFLRIYLHGQYIQTIWEFLIKSQTIPTIRQFLIKPNHYIKKTQNLFDFKSLTAINTWSPLSTPRKLPKPNPHSPNLPPNPHHMTSRTSASQNSSN